MPTSRRRTIGNRQRARPRCRDRETATNNGLAAGSDARDRVPQPLLAAKIVVFIFSPSGGGEVCGREEFSSPLSVEEFTDLAGLDRSPGGKSSCPGTKWFSRGASKVEPMSARGLAGGRRRSRGGEF